jgi:hypothetical protein
MFAQYRWLPSIATPNTPVSSVTSAVVARSVRVAELIRAVL